MQIPIPKRYCLIYIALISGICAVAYHGLSTHPWSYDDLHHLEHAKIAQQNISHIVSTQAKEPLRFVLNLYFYLAYKIFGDTPAGYHAAKIVFHIFNSLLCARVYLALFRDPLRAALAGFIFAIHGAHYEAIYHISGTGYLLGTAFVLLSVLQTLHHLESGRLLCLAGSIAAFAAAVFSYEGYIAAICPLIYLWWMRTEQTSRPIGLPVGLLAVSGCFILAERLIYRWMAVKADFYSIELGLHVPYNFLLFIGRLVINAHITPLGWDVLPPYDMPRESVDLYVLGGVLLVCVLIYLSRHSGAVQFSTVWMFTTILPYILGARHFYYPRYWYLPAVGCAGFFAHFLLWGYHFRPHRSRHRIALLSAVLIALTASSLQKIKTFEGYLFLYTANYYTSPEYGNDLEAAIRYYGRVISEYGITHHILYYNLGSCYLDTGRFDQARDMYLKALQLNPDYAPAYKSLGIALFRTGAVQETIQAYTQAARLDPGQYLVGFQDLGSLLLEKGHVDDAEDVYRKALQMDPNHKNNALMLCNLGVIAKHRGDIDTAIQAYRKSIGLRPDFTPAYRNLGDLLVNRQNWSAAVPVLEKAATLDPTDVRIWHQLARSYENLGRKEEANKIVQRLRASVNP